MVMNGWQTDYKDYANITKAKDILQLNIHKFKGRLSGRGVAGWGTKVAFFERNTCRTLDTQKQGNGIWANVQRQANWALKTTTAMGNNVTKTIDKWVSWHFYHLICFIILKTCKKYAECLPLWNANVVAVLMGRELG